MNIGIVTPELAHADAVSNDVRGMQRALNQWGHKATIFVGNNLTADHAVRPIDQISGELSDPQDVFIYHFSVGWDVGLKLLRELPNRKVVKYHNVTPPEFYEEFSSEHAHVCRTGRSMLTEIARSNAELFLSDSAYSMRELIAFGAPPCRSHVVPPFHQIEELLNIEADLKVLDSLRDGKMNSLMIGRVAPNKGHLELIDAFARYHDTYNELSRLVILGKQDHRLRGYTKLIHEQVARLNLQDDVVFVDEATEEQLKGYLLACHVFTIASEHEGFCVPLVEAMAHQLPIVAYSSTAIDETTGDAGFVWPERDSGLFAAAMNEIVSRPEVMEGLAYAGWYRYKQLFSREAIEKTLVAHIERSLTL